MVTLMAAMIAVAPALTPDKAARITLGGRLGAQVRGIVDNWLIPMPDRNPAVLGMFQDRDTNPPKALLPWSGEFAGKYLTGGTEMYRLTRDPKLKARLQRFVDDLIACQDADGYLGPFQKPYRLKNWAPNTWGKGDITWDAWGHYHAILGLLAWHEATGDAKALNAARKIGDLLVSHYGEKGQPVGRGTSPEMNQAAVHGLTLLHKRTGEVRYLDLAEKIVREFAMDGAGNYLEGALAGEGFWQLPANGTRWESLHSLMALPELYWLTGNADYRKAFDHHYWSIAETGRHNNGGFSTGEGARGNPYLPGAIETCCTVAWAALGVEQLRLTGDPHVADELEMSLLNQVRAMTAPDGSWCTYNTPMDGVRVPSKEEIGFQIRPGSEDVNCCTANFPRAFGMISDWAMMRDAKGIVLNYYGPSTLETSVHGVKVGLRQETAYPQEGRIELHVEPTKPTRFALRLRVPHWSEATRLRVNGKPVSAKAGSYVALEREWKKGDRVTLDLDMRPWFWVGQREQRGKVSVYRGPTLMALQTPGGAATYSGAWEGGPALRVSQAKGAAVEHRFEGDVVRVRAMKYDDGGEAEAFVDGKSIGTIDFYGPKRDVPFVWKRTGFGAGTHTLRLVALGTKAEDSKSVWINVGGFEPAWQLPSFEPEAFAQAKQKGEAMIVKDVSGREVTLLPYAIAGDNRMPYATWLPCKGLRGAPFSRENPSRTTR
ncbi:hypothetical protein EON82_11600 [bacterium]|nr:MAG: hypothetical protein EON82_11600 [bacterium]